MLHQLLIRMNPTVFYAQLFTSKTELIFLPGVSETFRTRPDRP
jgi:hypothetical protein